VKSLKKASKKRKAGDNNSQDILDSVLKNEKNLITSTPGKKIKDKKKTKKNSRKTM
jgi:hypothetical protein